MLSFSRFNDDYIQKHLQRRDEYIHSALKSGIQPNSNNILLIFADHRLLNYFSHLHGQSKEEIYITEQQLLQSLSCLRGHRYKEYRYLTWGDMDSIDFKIKDIWEVLKDVDNKKR